ncbi:immunoglobulin superfamily member 10-like isoform X2 [Onychostoma macrolepis]|uniref:immunoglobulin superfamily member 10-like isoform X2 n=1 Tax=Onychostoma macrolepis TaxID=369639 RepID=UPI0027299629|nr:immunoglobulin superfamily member 10-like isoform X2 [Onychostoma macrolepis]XP_058619795.1 immunoglobulin superfamily member 10-like isoform X2 [Onychostoma macrolepis]
MASDVMCLCVFLLCSGLQFTTGESALLPCRDINSQHTGVQWWICDPQMLTLKYSVYPADAVKGQRYKDRVQTHGNLSLSITRLTVDDAGTYCCKTTDPDKMSHVHLTVEGCSVSGNEGSVEIGGYSGDSVLLSCSVKCSGRYEPGSEFRWKLPNNREIKQAIDSTELHRLYQGRFHMFNISSGNLSLLISDLTEKDEGPYSCWSKENQHKNFTLTVTGCTLSETGQKPKTKYTGDSVLLSCSCEDPNAKPEDFRWTHVESSGTEVSNETPRYKDRVHMFHKTTPSNLSLLISNLTEDDQGTYRCTVNNKTSADTKLIVKGCVLSEHHITKSSYAGGSVTLPCSCKDPKSKPEHFEWKRAAVNETLVSDAEEINGRFQMIRDSPHKLFLRISNLTETDGGVYVCSVNGKQSRHVNLTLTDSAVINALEYQYYQIFLVFLLCLMLLLVVGCICWRFTRAKKGSIGSREIQRANDEDEVTYSTVRQIKGRKPAEKRQQNDVTYAAVALNKRVQSTEDDVTYSSVTHIKWKKRPHKKEEEVVYSTMADMSRSAQDDVTYSSVVHIESHKPKS